MSDLGFVAAIIILLAGAAIIGINIYKNKKNGTSSMTIPDIIDTFGDQIIDILKDTIKVLKINMKDYSTKEEYETAVINNTFNAIKENAIDFGIPSNIFECLSSDAITKIIVDILNENKVDVFSVLDQLDVDKFRDILDFAVVQVLGSAEEKPVEEEKPIEE